MKAHIVYRLIDEALIGKVSIILSYFEIEILAKCCLWVTLRIEEVQILFSKTLYRMISDSHRVLSTLRIKGLKHKLQIFPTV